MTFSFRGRLEGGDTIDKYEREMRPGVRYRWTVTASSAGEGKLWVVARAPEPVESAMWEGGVRVIEELALSPGQTSSGTFTVPQVHTRSGLVASITRVVFRFSRPLLGMRCGYNFSATHEE